MNPAEPDGDRRPVWTWPVPFILVGAALGTLGARYVLVGSGWSLLPWGLVALAIGGTVQSRSRTVVAAASYGFSLSLAFLVAGYDGDEPLAHHLVGFAALGLFGAACAVTLSLAGRLIRRARPLDHVAVGVSATFSRGDDGHPPRPGDRWE